MDGYCAVCHFSAYGYVKVGGRTYKACAGHCGSAKVRMNWWKPSADFTAKIRAKNQSCPGSPGESPEPARPARVSEADQMMETFLGLHACVVYRMSPRPYEWRDGFDRVSLDTMLDMITDRWQPDEQQIAAVPWPGTRARKTAPLTVAGIARPVWACVRAVTATVIVLPFLPLWIVTTAADTANASPFGDGLTHMILWRWIAGRSRRGEPWQRGRRARCRSFCLFSMSLILWKSFHRKGSEKKCR